MQNYNLPSFGAGAGLRHEHFAAILEQQPPFRWFEIIMENFIGIGGYTKRSFDQIREQYRIIPHGVCLSIGSTDPLDFLYLRKVKNFLDEIDAPWTSDHLCFTMVDHTNLNELIPLPFTRECVNNVVERVKVVQDVLQRPLLLENVTRYLTLSDREMSEAEFLTSILEESNCGLLLDVTNVQLNSIFHGYDAYEFIASLPLQRVGQIHLAGWEEEDDGQLIDSHDAPVPDSVWKLFQQTLELVGETSVLIEWDAKLPAVERLLQETTIAQQMIDAVCGLDKDKLVGNGA